MKQTTDNTIPPVAPMYTDQVLTGVHPKADARLASAFAAETSRQQAEADALIDTFGIGAGTEPAQPFTSMHADRPEDDPTVAAEMGAQVRRCEAATLARMGDLTTRAHIENAEQLRGYLLRLGIYVAQAGVELDSLCVGDGEKALTASMLQKISDAARMIDRAADSVIDQPPPMDEEMLAEAREDAKRRYMDQLRKGV